MTRITLKDVAAHAGVSHQTVSNVLNGHPSIRPATRDRVLAAIHALDYHPNLAAKALRESRTTTLCCVFYDMNPDDLSDPYRNLVQSAFISGANAQGYSMIAAFVSSGRPEDFSRLRTAFLQRRFGGALVVGASLASPHLQVLRDWQLPTVLFDHTLPAFDLPSVTADYEGGMAQLVAHHAARGRQRLALVIPQGDQISSAVARREGFLKAVRQHQLEARVVQGDWSAESGEAALRGLWSGDFRPDAVLCGNDRMAAGALRAAHQLQLRVPQEVAISGVDDFEIARYTTPALTTLQVPYAEMARQALQELLLSIGGQTPGPLPRTLPTQLVVRDSA